MPTVYPVILSGGSGSRLWPLSREYYPKQFLALHSRQPMLLETINRVSKEDGFEPPTIICNQAHRFLVAQCFYREGVKPRAIFLEPCARNTAPAVAVAAIDIARVDPDGLMLVMPSDHVITELDVFQNAVRSGYAAASNGFIITFGIDAQKPETGYGYIKKGDALRCYDGVYEIKKFVEKPDQKTAEKYISQGGFAWNSGVFLFKASAYLTELANYMPDVCEAADAAVDAATIDMDFIRLDEMKFGQSPSISIDYAVMEKTQRGAMVPIDLAWSDIGSWKALWEVSDKDKNGNVFKGDALLHNVKGSLISTSPNKLTAAIGVEDLIIVNTDDVLMVVNKHHTQDVKAIVASLRENGRSEAFSHTTVHRPWGTYRVMDSGKGYLVKNILVYPQSKLSLQYHNHRAEHWIVVNGRATVTRNKDVFILDKNQSTYIPLGATHRLENLTESPLIMIEVQSGDYLGEDDIVRLEDVYGRNQAE